MVNNIPKKRELAPIGHYFEKSKSLTFIFHEFSTNSLNVSQWKNNGTGGTDKGGRDAHVGTSFDALALTVVYKSSKIRNFLCHFAHILLL